MKTGIRKGETHSFGMPLDADDRKFFVVHGFDYKIVAVLCHEQAVAYGADTLVVGAVGDGGASVKPFGESASGSFCGMDFVSAWHALMQTPLGHWNIVC